MPYSAYRLYCGLCVRLYGVIGRLCAIVRCGRSMGSCVSCQILEGRTGENCFKLSENSKYSKLSEYSEYSDYGGGYFNCMNCLNVLNVHTILNSAPLSENSKNCPQ